MHECNLGVIGLAVVLSLSAQIFQSLLVGFTLQVCSDWCFSL